MTDRALTPVVGIALMLGVTILLAAAAGASLIDVASLDEPPQHASISVRADAETSRITLTHEAGPALDVRDLTIKVEIDGRPLFHQPPVPFVGARGFRGAPTGPFNPATDPEWRGGESASFQLAGTNRPELDVGDSVVLTIFEGDYQLLEVTGTAR